MKFQSDQIHPDCKVWQEISPYFADREHLCKNFIEEKFAKWNKNGFENIQNRLEKSHFSQLMVKQLVPIILDNEGRKWHFILPATD